MKSINMLCQKLKKKETPFVPTAALSGVYQLRYVIKTFQMDMQGLKNALWV